MPLSRGRGSPCPRPAGVVGRQDRQPRRGRRGRHQDRQGVGGPVGAVLARRVDRHRGEERVAAHRQQCRPAWSRTCRSASAVATPTSLPVAWSITCTTRGWAASSRSARARSASCGWGRWCRRPRTASGPSGPAGPAPGSSGCRGPRWRPWPVALDRHREERVAAHRQRADRLGHELAGRVGRRHADQLASRAGVDHLHREVGQRRPRSAGARSASCGWGRWCRRPRTASGPSGPAGGGGIACLPTRSNSGWGFGMAVNTGPAVHRRDRWREITRLGAGDR